MKVLASSLWAVAGLSLAAGIALKFAVGCWIGNWLFGLFAASAIAAAFIWLRVLPKTKTN